MAHHLIEVNPDNCLALVSVRSPFTEEKTIHEPWLHQGVLYIPAGGTVLVEEHGEQGVVALTLHLYGEHLPTKLIEDLPPPSGGL